MKRSDSLLLVRQACEPGGLQSAKVEIQFKGKLIQVSDTHFDYAREVLSAGQGNLVSPPPEVDRQALSAAISVTSLSTAQVKMVQRKALAGDESSERVYHAIVLAALCRMRAQARDIMRKALSGDPTAKAAVVKVVEIASGKRAADKSKRAQAQLSACLFRDAKAFCEAEGDDPPEPAQQEGAAKSNDTSTSVVEGIVFDARGEPVVGAASSAAAASASPPPTNHVIVPAGESASCGG